MNLGEWLLVLFFIFIWVAWIRLVIAIIVDIFHSDDLSGWGKAAWTLLVVFFTWIGVLIYLIARGQGMNARRIAEAAQMTKMHDDCIRQIATDSEAGAQPSAADEIAKLADLRHQGLPPDEEFAAQKAKILA